ncbi:MAG: dTDP-4-dehydrorhamnose reductase [Phaeodactylibacter sp.]|nr:dTDP-4-dehydrorhamnose reductase [Phaeodactylibacter sp.]MCB9048972.1 dTDP-4-dehydrorhamnose reductase [Lewinellaceae bacterium]
MHTYTPTLKHIVVTGANGQLGREFRELEQAYPGFRFTFTGREELDVTQELAIREFFAVHAFDYCINCAAYTAVDKAESEPDAAHKGNVDAPRWLAEACARQGIPLVHYSTDYVYHNQQNTPFKEGDSTTPQSVYARTKLAGEQAALAANPQTLIVRTSWVYSSFGHNFVKTMLRLGKERDELKVVFDQVGTPTYARGLARATLEMIREVEQGEVPRDRLKGIYHFSDEGVCSWYDFALAIFELAGIECRVLPIETKDFPTAALRPPYSVLNKGKIKEVFGLEIGHWREELRRMIARMHGQV